MALSPAKSLGEKLHDAACIAYGGDSKWKVLDEAARVRLEKTALHFAASLSFDEQTQAAIDLARAQGRASLEERCAALEEALAGVQPWAEMGFFLRDNQSSAYGDRYSQPEELTIQWEWQQSTPDDYGDVSLRHDIDGWLESLLEDASPEVLEHPVVKSRALLATPGERENGDA